MATTSNDIEKAKPTRLGSYLRNAPASASLKEKDWGDLADFLISLDFNVWETFDDLEDLNCAFGDIEFLGRTSTLSEGLLRAKKSTSPKRAYARKWYKKNKGRLAARRRKLKNSISAKAKQKKKERLRKQRKKLNKKSIRKYPSAKNHNESRATFAELVKPLSEKYSVKESYKKKEIPRYFIPEKSFMLNEMKISAGQKFILIGSEIFFEIDEKKFKVDNPVPVIPYLKEIR